ncbi:MAG: hypothetical protein H6R17_2629 [Proteobacteria bacterium]|nr:hypothetical protein [Pseudomonadota bacterium]
MVKEVSDPLRAIADTFGLLAESLESLSEDELVGGAEYCQSCDDWARKCVQLEADLAECRADLELHRKQIEALLRSVTD